MRDNCAQAGAREMNRSLLRMAFVSVAANSMIFSVYRLLCFQVIG